MPASANYRFRGCQLAAALLLLLTALLPSQSRADEHLSEAALWDALRTGEAFAIMRHAMAPGTGDPTNFDVDDCSTQRNLNDVGRDQARRIGQRFRDNGIESAEILTSQWCRCRDTAELLGLGEVSAFPALNSFFRNSQNRAPQTTETRDYLATKEIKRPLVLVTHQVNISALIGMYTSSGETLVVKPGVDGAMTLLGSLGDTTSQ